MLMLRVPLAAGALDILEEIEHWLRHPAAVDTVCNAAACEPVMMSPTVH
jgi:hypothetical protein